MGNDAQLSAFESTIKKYVRELKKRKLYFFDIPEEYRLHPTIVKVERALGIRRSTKRGFDILQHKYFVEEIVLEEKEWEQDIRNVFIDFASYYEFLEGDIYENACYFQHIFLQTEIDAYSIDLNRINTTAFINTTISEFTLEILEKELHNNDEKKKLEKEKNQRKKWIDKFNSCSTFAEFETVLKNYRESEQDKRWSYSDYGVYIRTTDFFVYNFIFADKEKAFDIIMEYVSNRGMYEININGLCSIYDPEKVLAAYDCNGSISTRKKHKGRLRSYIKCLNNNEVKFLHTSYFDENTGFFVVCSKGYIDEYSHMHKKFRKECYAVIYRYFATFEKLAEYLNNDLSGCDLSKAELSNIDFSIYKTDRNTKLPVQNLNELTYACYKGYDRENENFVVSQRWIDKKGQTVGEHKDIFKYFFDFLFFLNGDLSDADLLFCDGIDNLCDFSSINLNNARLRSSVLDQIEEEYPLCVIDNMNVESFSISEKNEEETADLLISKHQSSDIIEESHEHERIICYVSDLHLEHRVHNANCKSENDVLYVVQRIVDMILGSCSGSIILIGGDTASEYSLFCLFIHLLRKSIDEKGWNVSVIFLIGNHELWNFPEYSFEEIVQQYTNVISEHKMYILQNNIIYYDDYNGIQNITTNELLSLAHKEIRERLNSARIILFGGLAFSGYNEAFNANNGIYRCTIDREQEIVESKEFEKLYNIICKTLSDKKVIIFTHTPQSDWCSDKSLQPKFIYVSGHTHRNYFYDDGEYRIYADNQIGYKSRNVGLKHFYLEDDCDLFSEYGDGIYEITKKQYIDFYREKNIQMQFTRDVNILYMLKKGAIIVLSINQKQISLLS